MLEEEITEFITFSSKIGPLESLNNGWGTTNVEKEKEKLAKDYLQKALWVDCNMEWQKKLQKYQIQIKLL